MYRVKTLYLNPYYDPDLLKRNTDLIGFVVEKSSGKVEGVAVVTREGLANWYESRRAKYPEDQYTLLIGSTSIVGELRGAELGEVDEKKSNLPSDPLKYTIN